MLILKTIISVIFIGTNLQAIEPPPPQQQVDITQEQAPDSQAGASSYTGTMTQGGQSLTNVDDNANSPQPAPTGTVQSGTPSSPSSSQVPGTTSDLNSTADESLNASPSPQAQPTAPSQAPMPQPAMPAPSGTAMQPSAPNAPGTDLQQDPSLAGTATQQMQSDSTCSSLKNPEHAAFAKQLTGNELTLFCSIFDDGQRDQVIAYVKNSQMDPKDAVIQVGKDSGILFSQTPGGACGAH